MSQHLHGFKDYHLFEVYVYVKHNIIQNITKNSTKTSSI
jgi:hypothetical protein